MKLTLEILLNETGFRKDYLAEKIGISKQAFNNKMKERVRFKEIELNCLAEIIEVSPYFLRRLLSKPIERSQSNETNRS